MIHGAVIIFTERATFKEGICPKNVTVANNKFIGNYGGDVSVFSYGSLGPRNGGITKGLIENIEITNNFFANTPVTSLTISACSNSRATCNLFYNTSLNEDLMYGVTIDNSEDLVIENNYFYSDIKTRMSALDIDGATTTNIEKKNNKFEKIS